MRTQWPSVGKVAEDPLETLVDDIKRLRKGVGLTLDRLGTCHALLAACGASNDSLSKADRAIRDSVQELGDSKYSIALRAALDIDHLKPGPTTIADRRAALAKDSGRDVATVRRWEERGVRELAQLLFSKVTTPAVPQPTTLLLRRSVEAWYGTDRHWLRSTHRFALVSLVSGRRVFKYATSEDTILSCTSGLRPRVHLQNSDGTTVWNIDLGRALQRGDHFSFGVVEQRRMGSRLPPYEEVEDKISQSFESPCQSYSVTAHFQEPIVPRSLWSFQQLHLYERPGKPLRQNRVPILPDPTVRFANLYGGMYSGLAWRW